MKLGTKYSVLRPPTKAVFPVDEGLVRRQRLAKAILDELGVKPKALRNPDMPYLTQEDVRREALRKYPNGEVS